MRVMKTCLVLLSIGLLSFFLLPRFLHSNMSVSGHWACSGYIITTFDGRDYHVYDHDDCYYVIDYIIFSDQGGGSSNGQPIDPDDPSSGWGGSGGTVGPSTPNPYDNNNDGIIDCYKTGIMRKEGLYISSDCNEIRQKADGTTYTHGAWDITGPGIDGAKIYPAASGTVISVTKQTVKVEDPETGEAGYMLTGYGYYVRIKDSDGNIWLYAHLKGTGTDPSGVGLKVGDKVIAGTTPIGLGDSSGNSTGPHLHLEYLLNGTKTCPDEKIGNC
ncbi:MAG: M23 family metallopeptidase [Acidobacteriota bacterium]|nr:M23 family metallopeptidase [Acidobacteriota bacterium]